MKSDFRFQTFVISETVSRISLPDVTGHVVVPSGAANLVAGLLNHFTVGIVLCHRKNDALVELTLPKDANIFASKYQLYLPSKAELKAKLEQIEAELEGKP